MLTEVDFMSSVKGYGKIYGKVQMLPSFMVL